MELNEGQFLYPLTNGETCKRCGVVNMTWLMTPTGLHQRAECPSCGSYIKFVSKKELDIPRRSIRSSEVKSSERYKVLQRDGHRCVSCGRVPPDVILHVDHIIPVQEGGDDEQDNLVTLCEECNIGKSDGYTLRDAFVLWLRRRGRRAA